MNNNDIAFEGLLKQALYKYRKQEFDSYPDDNELKRLYPIPKKELHFAAKMSRNRKSSPFVKWTKRVAIIFLCFVTLSFGLLMTDVRVRSSVTEAVIKWFNGYAEVEFTGSDGSVAEKYDIQRVKVNYIPDGFDMISSLSNDKMMSHDYISKDKSKKISISVFEPEIGTVYTDTDHSSYTSVEINGLSGYFVLDNNEALINLIYGNESISVFLSGMNVEKTEILRIAENIELP